MQAGRALAALAVVVHHASLAARDFGSAFWGFSILESGYLGVDFFFVLSGFIIFHSTVPQNRELASYAQARFRRVYLPYWPVGLGIAVLYTVAPGLTAGSPDWAWLPTLTLLPTQSSTALTVAWTLQHEVLFYFVFGICFYGKFLKVGLSVRAMLILLNWLMPFSDFIPFALINLEFLMGVVVAANFRTALSRLHMIVVALIPFGVWIMLGCTRASSPLIGLALAMCIAPLVKLEREGRVKVGKALTFLGAASYSLYLVHGVAISVVARILPSRAVFILFGGVLASLVAGSLYYLVVERRLLKRKVATAER